MDDHNMGILKVAFLGVKASIGQTTEIWLGSSSHQGFGSIQGSNKKARVLLSNTEKQSSTNLNLIYIDFFNKPTGTLEKVIPSDR